MNGLLDNMHFLVLNTGFVNCGTDWNFSNICSPFTRIYYIEKGHAQIVLADRVVNLRPGYMYIIPSFTTHSDICRDEEFSQYYIHIYNESEQNILDNLDFPLEIEAEPYVITLIQRLQELCPNMELRQYAPQDYDNFHTLSESKTKNKGREFSARTESRGILYIILSRFINKATPKTLVKDQRIAKVLQFIHSNINTKISLTTLSTMACMSQEHLIRMFKKELNTTPTIYITQKKMERAQIKLITENVSISELAYQLGFDNLTYFTKVFKKFVGTTPQDYRKKHSHSNL